jgi:hypothetical protein
MNSPGNSLFWGNESIFGIHTFFTSTISCHFINAILTNPNIAYATLLAIGNLLAGLLGFLLVRDFLSKSQSVLAGVLLSFSGFAFGSVTYPHPEALGGALAGLGIYGLVREKAGWWIFLGLGILTREDIGIHLGIVTLCSVFLLNSLTVKLKRKLLFVSLASISSSVFLKILQLLIFPTRESVFGRTYLGSPPFSSLKDPQVIIMRVSYWIQNNSGILGFFLILYLLFKATNGRIFLVPMIASLPWILINLIAVDPAKQILQLYESFPFLVYLPIIAISMNSDLKSHDSRLLARKMVLVLFAWIATYGSLAGGQVGSAGSINVGVQNMHKSFSGYRFVENNKKSLENFLSTNPEVQIDSGVATLFPLFDSRMFNSATDLATSSAILYYPLYSLNGTSIESFRTSPGLKKKYCSKESPLILETNVTFKVTRLKELGLGLCK